MSRELASILPQNNVNLRLGNTKFSDKDRKRLALFRCYSLLPVTFNSRVILLHIISIFQPFPSYSSLAAYVPSPLRGNLSKL